MAFQLHPKAIKVGARPAVGFHAELPWGHGDYYFDLQTGLLAEADIILRPKTNREAAVKTILGDYREIDRAQFPYRRSVLIKRDQDAEYIPLTTVIVTKLEIRKTLPDDTFSLPKKGQVSWRVPLPARRQRLSPVRDSP